MINEAESPKAVIKKILQLVVDESLLGKEPRGCFMVNTCVENAPHDKAVAKIIHDNLQDYDEAFCQAIKKGQAMGERTSGNNAKAWARFIINTCTVIGVTAGSRR